MFTITIKKDNYAYFNCENDELLFSLLIKSFTRKEKKYNNFYKMYETQIRKAYSLSDDKKIFKVKSGLIPYLCNSMDYKGIQYNIIDERKDIDGNFELIYQLNETVKLRKYQIEAVDNVIRDRFCYVQIPTSGGKTEISASLIKSFLKHYNNEAVLYLVPTIKLQREATERFKNYNIPVNNKLPIIKGEANVLTYASIIRTTKSKFDYLQRNSIGMFIVDEAHHLSANKLSKVVHDLHNLRFSIGLSATPSEDNKIKHFLKELNYKEMLVFGCTGVCSYKLDIQNTIENNFVTPIEVRVLRNKIDTSLLVNNKEEVDWWKIKNTILKSNSRAQRVAEYVKHIVNEANLHTVVLLIPEINWSNIYMSEVFKTFNGEDNIKFFELYGGDKILQYNSDGSTTLYSKTKDIDRIYSMIENSNIKTIFSASTFFFEGISINNIQAIVNCYGGRDSKRVKQQTGRCMRLFEGKDVAYIHEIEDIGNVVLESQFNKRMKIYTEEYNAKIIYSEF